MMTKNFEQLKTIADQKWESIHLKPWIRVGTGILADAAGAQETLQAVRAAVRDLNLDATITEVGSSGLCFAEPIVDIFDPVVGRVLYGNVMPQRVKEIINSHLVRGKPKSNQALATVDTPVEGISPFTELPMIRAQTRIALRNAGDIDPVDIHQYVAKGGFEGLDKALSSLTREDVLTLVKESGLRGRGGAAFSTGTKWKFLASNTAEKKYILCNAEEGDPGAFNDKAILEGDPFTLIEGCIIAGYATGATNGIVFIRHGNSVPIERTKSAIKLGYEQGILGTNILGSDFSFEMEVSLVGHSYVAGEETALMEAIEGKRSMPRFRPPFPASYGVWGYPSNINNIKTLAYVPEIIRNGSAWFNGIGTPGSPGTAIVCLSGHIKYPGFYEIPFGISLRHMIEEVGGGSSTERPIKFLQTGGPLGGVLPAASFDLIMDFDSMGQADAMLGSGGIIVADESTSVVDLTRLLIAFDQLESCGKCFPCRLGMSHLLEILDRLCIGNARHGDIDMMEAIGTNMRAGSLCGHGQLGYNPIKSAMKAYREEFETQLRQDSSRLKLDGFIGPTSTMRGAQFLGETPTSTVYPEFTLKGLNPVVKMPRLGA